jgi:hypothetical protein
MKRYFTESEINQAKTDIKIRDGIMTELEAKLEIGKPRAVTVDGPDPENGYKMGVYRMTRRVATEDAIRQFCDAIGDFNPLYRDRNSLALCKGKVVKKYIQEREHLVDLSLTVENHDGHFLIPKGTATVRLPSRKMNGWKL